MGSMVQLLENLQLRNPEQTEVGVCYAAFLRTLGNLKDRVYNIKSATLSNGDKTVCLDVRTHEFEVFFT